MNKIDTKRYISKFIINKNTRFFTLKKSERRNDRKNTRKKLSEIDTRYIDQWDDGEDQHIVRGTN